MSFTETESQKIKKRMQNVNHSKVFNNLIGLYNLSHKSVLDIGCSYGEYLHKFGPNSLGLTVNPKEVEWGKINNLPIILGNIEENFDTEKKFDVLFANNIFEHTLAPHLFLQNIKKYVKKDGILILGVPCVPTIFCLTYFSIFSGYKAAAHTNFFTRYTLQKTVEYAGWHILQNRSFLVKKSYLDFFLHMVCPHFFIVAKVNSQFSYCEKRKVELNGYNNQLLKQYF